MKYTNDGHLLILHLKDDARPAAKTDDTEARAHIIPCETARGKEGEAETMLMDVTDILQGDGGPGSRCKIVEELRQIGVGFRREPDSQVAHGLSLKLDLSM